MLWVRCFSGYFAWKFRAASAEKQVSWLELTEAAEGFKCYPAYSTTLVQIGTAKDMHSECVHICAEAAERR